MKCSPLFLTSPTGVWKESFRLWLNKQNIQEPLSCLNPLSGKESFRPQNNNRKYSIFKESLNPLSGKESFRPG